MSASRRSVLGAAMAAPLLAQFTGTASADTAEPGALGTVSDGWIEVRWTEQAQALLDRFQAVVEPVAPARLVQDAKGKAIRFPVRSGAGDPALTDPAQAHGDARLDGGVQIRTPEGTVRVTDVEGALRDGLASGKGVVNGFEVAHRAVARPEWHEGVLRTESVPLGRPMRVRITDVPLRPTPEMVETFGTAFGEAGFTTATVLGHVTAEGVYTPPKA
ncbi:hypothetical protein HZZ00_16530 [Streptomyces sp. NEAU-sy36]|uniref:hypothetical protein n=1 Tax=unclassified Streptomyces TaxID=2593676 RepID=UPI0015D6527E|nr:MULTISPECIES: hypothetical protein [unclassified Streptomyces]QLJ02475.1 hypothetical protein HZZ00_16530 [Streptomyces sp. NEAU-sy36]